MTGAPSYDWWLSALELVGCYGELSRQQIYALGGVHEDVPQPGFYRIPPSKFVVVDGTRRRRRESDGMEDDFVAIWPTNNGVAACINGEPTDPSEVWTRCCHAPVSEDRFRRNERVGFRSGLTLGLTA